MRRSKWSVVLWMVALFSIAPVSRAVVPDFVFGNGFDDTARCAGDPSLNDFDVPGNGLDDDCNGTVDDPATVCDIGLASSDSDPVHYANAMDLCRTASEAGPGWGLVSATLSLASGTGTVAAQSRSIRPAFGSGNLPRAGQAFAVLSTGAAAAMGQTNPAFAEFQPGIDTLTQSAAPADWLAANGGAFPHPSTCPTSINTTAFNPVMLTLRIRVPDNAVSFSVAAKYFGAEFAEFVCTAYNDVFVALLDSTFTGLPANPADRDLATYRIAGGAIFPFGANLAVGDTGLFTQCVNGMTGCAGPVSGTISTCTGTTGLTGTGFDLVRSNACFVNTLVGGGTDWLVIRGNVVPGEIVTLRLAVWDTSDVFYDSVILLDDFRWSAGLAEPGVSAN